MKTLREALAVVANGFTTHRKTLTAALDELEMLRDARYNFETKARHLDSERAELLAALEKANEFLTENAPRDGLGMVDPAANRERRSIMAQVDAAIANTRGGQ